MTRDPRLPVRPQAVPRRDQRPIAPPAGGWRPELSTLAVALGLLILLVGVPFFVVNSLGPARPDGSGASGSPGPTGGSPGPSGSTGTSGGASPTPSPTPEPPKVPLVPVVSFWSTRQSIGIEALRRALEGGTGTFERVAIPEPDADAIAAALGVELGADVRKLRAAGIRRQVADGALGLLRITDITPEVRALAVNDKALFGVEREPSYADWPILIADPTAAEEGLDPAADWTLVAGGDILLDRGVARQVKVLEKGVDFPFDGGRAQITGYTCCSGFGYKVPTYRRTGDEGGMRRLLSQADLALANLETPVDDDFTYHTQGTVFNGDPKLLEGIDNAGIDFLSLANNHIRDAGPDGIVETVEGLDRLGIAHSGAGEGVTEARKPAVLEVGDQRVAVIGCDAIAQGNWTTGDETGSYSCASDDLPNRIRAAKRANDIVIIYPHWGVEYRATPSADQRDRGQRWVEAGADLVIGNHAHWTAAIEAVDGKLVFYALGNFVFDQAWSEATMEGVLLEMTFHGSELRQVVLHPTLILDQAQPNFMAPGGDGQVVIDRMHDASEGLLPY